MLRIDFDRLQVGQVICNDHGEHYRITATTTLAGGRAYTAIGLKRNDPIRVTQPEGWHFVVLHETVRYTNTFVVPGTTDPYRIVTDDDGWRMALDADADQIAAGDSCFSVTLASPDNASDAVKQDNRFVHSLLGRRVRVTVEVLD